MAKWCDRDPRWLVADLADGNNVNGWHWEEKNKLPWSRTRLSELLSGLQCSHTDVQITGVTDLTGEALLTVRKGNKKFAVFDLTLTLAWSGQSPEDSKQVEGEVKITEFASTNDETEYLFEVTATGSGKGQDALKKAVQGMRGDILKQLAVYVAEMGAMQQ